jgi:predicted GNAT family acetyltransferase
MHVQNEIVVDRLEADGQGAFFVIQQNTRVAELTYTRVNPDLVTIDHTHVDERLRGLGVARKLLDAAVAWARSTKTKLSATCPYATTQFERDASIRDVLAA